MDVLEKNLLVLASAGSGKTFTLSDRIIGLVAGGADPESIVALTFTRKAAGEFAEAILRKLAEAANDPEKAVVLEKTLGRKDVDFTALLENVVRKLPRLTLTTMDAFFAKIVRNFQYELGVMGGKFDLLEGAVAEAAKDELLEGLLDGGLDSGLEEEFLTTFRRATAGKEGARVLEELRGFIADWHRIFVSREKMEWGPAALTSVKESDWEKEKHGLIQQVRRDWPNVPDRKKRHDDALEPMLTAFQEHTVGSGALGKASGLVPKILEQVPDSSGPIDISYYQPLRITGLAAQALRDLVELAAHCELAAALDRTRGVREVIAAYDSLVAQGLRAKGKLGFDDVKRLMGAWMMDEDARLRREAVDFRLDATYGHWLLDEFQDTSRDEWDALLPLIDEGLTDPESTVFVVGDKKQAIYAWRGGEIGLFDELIETYSTGLKTETMAQSWRSCPQVLAMVNRVCGDMQTMSRLFGAAANDWEWEEHISATPLATLEKAGCAKVEIVPKEEKMERVIAQLNELGIGRKELSCGILLESNKHVSEWADALREAGFQVVEEGAREPARDHPVGVMIWQLLRWLADPSDDFAKQTVMISPLKPVLEEHFGAAWQAIWEQLSGMISEQGFSETIAELISTLMRDWSDFGQRRAAELVQALKQLDHEKIATAREAAERIGRLKISQSPGVAAVQVMTVHKAKGLGFDVVILPDVSTKKVPDFSYFKMIAGDGWVTSAPTSWARAMIPELCEAEQKWSRQQTYEAFCKLYVAMTRAKRGLYILLDEPAKSAAAERTTLANWLICSLELESDAPLVIGKSDWSAGVKALARTARTESKTLGSAIPKRIRSTPSGEKSKAKLAILGSSSEGRRFGTEVHAAFERIGWLDEGKPPVFPDRIGSKMDTVLTVPEIAELFSRNGREIALFREQRVEAVIDGKWISGVIDRLHVHTGEMDVVEIIDFKTDRVGNADELAERYAGQMETYRKAMKLIYPNADVKCLLISTALNAVVAAD